MTDDDTTTETKPKKHRARYRPGTSGNPKGRPKGAKGQNDKHTAMASRLANRIGAKSFGKIVDVLVTAALEGDTHAATLLLQRLWPAPRTRLVSFPMPKIETAEDVKMVITGLLNGVSQGVLTADEAGTLAGIASKLGEAVAEADFSRHLEKIQESMPKQIEGRAA
jgi:hypothetical protein